MRNTTMKTATRAIIQALTLAGLCASAQAQSTLDERIKKAEQAQIQKEAEAKAKEAEAKAKEDAAKAASAPRVIINGSPAHVGALVPVQPMQGMPPMAPPPPPRLELVEVKGFTDSVSGLSAIVYVSGQRYSVTMDQPKFGEGWELKNITADGVDVSKGSDRQQIRFVGRVTVIPTGPR